MRHSFNSSAKFTFRIVFNLCYVVRHALAQIKLLRFINNLFCSKVIQLNVHNTFLKSVVKIQGVITKKSERMMMNSSGILKLVI